MTIYSKHRSSNYFFIKHWVDSKFKEIEDLHFSKWIFMKNYPVETEYLSGKKISYSGIGFEGSPSQIFWSDGYIPEYIRSYILEGIKKTIESSRDSNTHPNKALLEFLEITKPHIIKVFTRMADIESRLLGDGMNIPKPRDVANKISGMSSYLNDVVEAEKLNRFDSVVWYAEQFGRKVKIIHALLGVLGVWFLVQNFGPFSIM